MQAFLRNPTLLHTSPACLWGQLTCERMLQGKSRALWSLPCSLQSLDQHNTDVQAALLGGTPASLASLDLLLEGLIRTAGLPARIHALQWALSLRHQILSEVGGHS